MTVDGRWDASYMDFMLVPAWKHPDGSHKSRPNSLTELFGKNTTQIYGTMGFMDLNIQYPIICKLYIYKNQSLRLNVRTLLHFTYSCSVKTLHKLAGWEALIAIGRNAPFLILFRHSISTYRRALKTATIVCISKADSQTFWSRTD